MSKPVEFRDTVAFSMGRFGYSCEKCGTKERGHFIAPRITVTIEPYAGEYCQTCFARWLSENIPKLTFGELA